MALKSGVDRTYVSLVGRVKGPTIRAVVLIEMQEADLHRQLNELQAATLPARPTAVEIARLTSRACSAFRTQEESEQRKLLSIVLKGASWKDQKLQTALFEPFELVRRSNHTNGNQINRLPVQKGDFQNWLPKSDSNLTLTPMP